MEMLRSIFAESSSDSETDSENTGEQHSLTTTSSITDTNSVPQHKHPTPDRVPLQRNPPVGRKWQNFISFSTPLPVVPPVLPSPTHPPDNYPVVCESSKRDLASTRPVPSEKVSKSDVNYKHDFCLCSIIN